MTRTPFLQEASSPPRPTSASELARWSLDDPRLPSGKELNRWYAEPKKARGARSPLIEYRASRGGPRSSRSTPRLPSRPQTAEVLLNAQPNRPFTPSTMITGVNSAAAAADSSGMPVAERAPRAGSATALLRTGSRPALQPVGPSRDPSTYQGNVMQVLEQLAEPPRNETTRDAFARDPDGTSPHMRSKWRLEQLDTQSRLAHWLAAFENEEMSFASKAVFVEMRLRQALASSVQLGTPNVFRCAIVCDAFERVAPLTGRLESILGLCWHELIKCIYADYSLDLLGSGAREYAKRLPHFLEARRLREQNEDQKRTMVEMGEQRAAENIESAARAAQSGAVLGAWNRARGFSAAEASAEELRRRVEELDKLLKDAMAEIARLQGLDSDPVAKCIAAYDACEDSQKEEVVTMSVLPSDAAATAMVGNPPAEVAECVTHLLSKLPDEDTAEDEEATSGRVVEIILTKTDALSDDEKLSLALATLKSLG